MEITKRVENLSPSITLSITSLVKDLKAQGKDILSFSAGEPDFDTPKEIKDLAIKAINENYSKYTAVEGALKVKKSIVKKLKNDHDLSYLLDDIVITNGGKQSLFNIFQVLIEKGDEVIIPSPYWVTYPEQVRYSGGNPIFIETNESSDFKITAKQLKNAITSKTKILLLNNPSNPTGAIYSEEELRELAKVLKGSDIAVISDEIYEKIIYDKNEYISVARISEDMFTRTITINGLSKSTAMTGWRFGYLASPNKKLIKEIIKLQGQCTSNINSITQFASVFALEGGCNKNIEIMRIEYEKRRDIAIQKFNSIPKISCLRPNGAFYLFVNIQNISNDSMTFCTDLLEKENVALVPGVSFGKEGYFRFSFATNLETIKEGIRRIEKFVSENY